MVTLVIDTNVLVAALRSGGGASRQVIRRSILGHYTALFSNALWLEYEDLIARPMWSETPSLAEREAVIDAMAASGRWVKIYYGWRPNLRDPGDDHLVELAVAGGARAIVTHNVRDIAGAELRWPDCPTLTPSACLERFP